MRLLGFSLPRLVASLLMGSTALSGTVVVQAAEFEKPVRLQADGKYIEAGSPGYAAPCWADVDHDGEKDLLVGQFGGGRIKVYKNQGDAKLAAGQWLEAEGQPVRIDGIY